MQLPDAAPSEVFILKSELAMRRHAVLMPADAPSAKRLKTGDLAEPGTCARAHAFISNSPLSVSKQPLQPAASVLTSPHDVIADPPDSAAASSEEDANFAIKSDSELEVAASEPAPPSLQPQLDTDQNLSGEASAQPELRAESTANMQERPQVGAELTEHKQIGLACAEEQQTVPNFAVPLQSKSQQESTVGASTSGISNTSHGTNVTAAVCKGEADSPASPSIDPRTNGPAEHLTVVPSRPSSAQTAEAGPSRHITVPQLLAAGPYRVHAESQHIVAEHLKTYKAKVDAFHAMGRVSSPSTQMHVLFYLCNILF